MTSKYKQIMSDLVNKSFGHTEGNFVSKPGVMLLHNYEGLTTQSKDLFYHFNICKNQSDLLQLSEFCSRITYLSFKDTVEDSTEYHKKMIQTYGHLSPYSMNTPCFLIAGCSIEAMLEFVAHKEASIARLTSSMTKAMDEPLFVIDSDIEKEYITKQLELRMEYQEKLNYLPLEYKNRLYLANKATAFVVGMNLKDWHKTFIGRISHYGVEKEMVNLCSRICEILHTYYPLIILTPDDYFNMNNSKKYSIE